MLWKQGEKGEGTEREEEGIQERSVIRRGGGGGGGGD